MQNNFLFYILNEWLSFIELDGGDGAGGGGGGGGCICFL